MKRILPYVLFVVVAATGLGMTAGIYTSASEAEKASFEKVADDLADRLQYRVEKHIAILSTIRALAVEGAGRIDADTFKSIVAGLDLEGEYRGIQGIGFARYLPTGKESMAAAEILANYGRNVKVRPEITDQAWRTPIVLLEPNHARAQAALGYDMFSQSDRREAMERAVSINSAAASAPVVLVQEITEDKQMGFLVYLPVRVALPSRFQLNNETENLAGFVYSPYRVGDLHAAALTNTSGYSALETRDITDSAEGTVIYQSSGLEKVLATEPISISRSLMIAGRTWQVTVYKSGTLSGQSSVLIALGLSGISLVLATSIAAYARSQIKAVEAIRALKQVSDKAVQEKDMMLQEMKHRIKNAIARINAISRQTARNAESVEDYAQTLSSRLQAMANAQDMLTRSSWGRADLHELLQKELEQVFGSTEERVTLEGHKLLLNESQTQAFSLVFHELATNAMKYGAMAHENGALHIRWGYQGKARRGSLFFTWQEEFDLAEMPDAKKGFGTKLIEANIISELGGQFERSFTQKGMEISIQVPIGRNKA